MLTHTAALEVARHVLPSALIIWLDREPMIDECDDLVTWTGRIERFDGSKATFAFDEHYPEGVSIEEAR